MANTRSGVGLAFGPKVESGEVEGVGEVTHWLAPAPWRPPVSEDLGIQTLSDSG